MEQKEKLNDPSNFALPCNQSPVFGRCYVGYTLGEACENFPRVKTAGVSPSKSHASKNGGQ